MKSLISCLFVFLLMLGCAGKGDVGNVGDGQFDLKEQAYFRLTVGAALTVYPDSIMPVYVVTDQLLYMLNNDIANYNHTLIDAINTQVEGMDLDPYTGASLIEAMELLKANLFSVLDGELIPVSDRVIVVKQMLTIINQSAKARIGL